jgi:hypothetical protein
MLLAAAALTLAAPTTAAADPGFAEPDVHVLQTWHGTPGGFFGWAVSELQDIDRDGATDVIAGEVNTAGGITWVFSGRTGKPIYRFDGQPGDQQGYAIADAGDTNRDGVHDIISGAPGNSKAYLYSGRTGALLHAFTVTPGDALGGAVSSAGDINHDGYDDVFLGAFADATRGANAGAAYVFSGRTYKPIRKFYGTHPGDLFGSGVDSAGGLLGNLIAGAPGANDAQVFSGLLGLPLLTLDGPPGGTNFGQFFVAGVGRVDGDRLPDLYVGDYGANGGNGYAAVYSGRDGAVIHQWPGGPGDGRGPGREAGDVDGDRHVDLAVGSYTAGPTQAGRVDVFSGATGKPLRTITSTTAGENLGFDAVGVGDVNRDGAPDLLISAATGNSVYLVAGRSCRHRC